MHDWKFHSRVEVDVPSASPPGRRWRCAKCGIIVLSDDRPDFDLVIVGKNNIHLSCEEVIAYKIHNE